MAKDDDGTSVTFQEIVRVRRNSEVVWLKNDLLLHANNDEHADHMNVIKGTENPSETTEDFLTYLCLQKSSTIFVIEYLMSIPTLI